MNKRRKQNLVISAVDAVGSVGIPFISGAVVLVAAVCTPLVIVASRRKAKRELILLWEFADQLGYTGTELQQLTQRADFGTLDWDMTRPGKNQSIIIPLDIIDGVLEQLRKIKRG